MKIIEEDDEDLFKGGSSDKVSATRTAHAWVFCFGSRAIVTGQANHLQHVSTGGCKGRVQLVFMKCLLMLLIEVSIG